MAFQDVLEDEKERAREEGRSEGLREGIHLVAKNLLKANIPLNQVSEMTNLSEEELLALRENES